MRSQASSPRTARMKSSVTSTERLKLRKRAGLALASMKASMSGWSHLSVAIMAPRRAPADMMVRHMASHTSMKLTGPDASAPMLLTRAPFGRSVEKSWPMPPPCCMVSAASLTFSKIEPRSSSMQPITKQLKSVTPRPVPAPARMRPAGRKAKSTMASANRPAQRSRARLGSAAATARATLSQVSAMTRSTGDPSAALRRYFMSQICSEIRGQGAGGVRISTRDTLQGRSQRIAIAG